MASNFIEAQFIKQKSINAQIGLAGVISTSSNGKDINDNLTNEKAETKAFLLGAKARVRAPIPYVAPYFEIGIGTSIGKFETFTAFDEIKN